MEKQNKKLTYEEWEKIGTQLYGNDKKEWKFKCPSCGFVQTFNDFIKAGATKEQAQGMIGFSCIGRVMEEKGEFLGKKQKSKACNYAGGGLFRINPVTIVCDGKEQGYFDFANKLNTTDGIPPKPKVLGILPNFI
jgi:hypothetical protein